MKPRSNWVDYAKGIGIILVVYGHASRGLANAGFPINKEWFELTDSVIYTFHMPLFFFLSGLFFYDSLVRRGRAGLFLEKFDVIVYPYIIWSLLQGFIEVLLSNYTTRHVSAEEVLSFLWKPHAQFWFLFALFQIVVVCSIIYSYVQQQFHLLVTVFFGLLYVYKSALPINTLTVFIIDNSIFFTLGIWFNKFSYLFEAMRKEWSLVLGVLFLAAQYVFHITFGLNFKVGGFPMLGLAALSIFFVIAVSMCLNQLKLKWLLLLGTSSMGIYLMHVLASSGARIFLSRMGIHATEGHLLIGTLSGLVVPLLTLLIIKRFDLDFLLTPPKSLARSARLQ